MVVDILLDLINKQKELEQGVLILDRFLSPSKKVKILQGMVKPIRMSLEEYDSRTRTKGKHKQAVVESRNLRILGPIESSLDANVVGPQFILVTS